MSAPTPAQLETARSCIENLRDALVAIATHSETVELRGIRAVAGLAVRHADEVLAEIKP